MTEDEKAAVTANIEALQARITESEAKGVNSGMVAGLRAKLVAEQVRLASFEKAK